MKNSGLDDNGKADSSDLLSEETVELCDLEVYPKECDPSKFLRSFVMRSEVVELDHRMKSTLLVPGVYISGPPGAGKSSLLYFMASRLRKKGYIVIYLPSWRRHIRKNLNMGRMLDAFNIACRSLQRKEKQIIDETVFNSGNEASWTRCCDRKKLEETYHSFHAFMMEDVKLRKFLIVDEVNNIFGTEGRMFSGLRHTICCHLRRLFEMA